LKEQSYITHFVSILLVALVLASTGSRAQKKVFGFSALTDTLAVEKNGFFLLPLLYYTPDTRWAYGAAGVYYFKVQPKYEYEKLTRISYIQFLADYTQNKQLDMWSIWNIFSRNENYLFKGELRFRDFPDRFYGIGNNTPSSAEEKYAYNLISIKNLAMKRIRPSLFVGLDYHFEYEYKFRYTEGGALEDGSVTGYRGGIGSAIGFVGVHDSRDNAINARSGKLMEVSTYLYTPALGSTFSFFSANGIYQHYWSVRKKQSLALQAKVRLSYGEVPFLDMSTVGGDDLLRGYPKNRFRDKHFAGTQLEYRFPVFWRFGMVAFAGLGDVFTSPNDIRMSTLKYSVGSGARFIVNTAERLNLRFDYAVGREGGYFYFSVAEAF
jgi:outer membrane protein assembly factor BamA